MGWWKTFQSKPQLRKLRGMIEAHLSIDLAQAHSVAHEIKPIERVNLQRVLDCWVADSKPPAKTCGYAATGYSADDGLLRDLLTDQLIQAPIERIQLDAGPNETLDCVQRGLVLLHHDGTPVVAAFRPPRFYREMAALEMLAPSREIARGSLSRLLDEAQRSSVYKGRALSLEQTRGFPPEICVRFHAIRPTRREDIVLPDELIEVAERNVLGMLRHAGCLREAGRSLRRGLLFHGPPGTGKTLMVRYLVNACTEHTIILLTGSQQALAQEACRIARLLAPSIVVLEDVDLLAEDREHNRQPMLLNDLLNEMDGLGARDEVTFLLTTNRPEVLEPALAGRPGRIDQAIAFPLPDENCRRRLFEVYGQGLDLANVDVERWVAQTNGVSPAFIEELLRKAALLAAERGEASRPMRLAPADLDNAVRELIYFGGDLTQKLLGYRTSKLGYHSSRE